jgi:hypothetical protein
LLQIVARRSARLHSSDISRHGTSLPFAVFPDRSSGSSGLPSSSFWSPLFHRAHECTPPRTHPPFLIVAAGAVDVRPGTSTVLDWRIAAVWPVAAHVLRRLG